MSKPLLLDLFCGGGGAAMGYHRAGFEIIGIDVESKPSYPFTFVRANVMELVGNNLSEYDTIHASPPCQLFSRAGNLRNAQGGNCQATDLLTPVLDWFQNVTTPWVVENVPGAPLGGITLCGSMFGLRVRRHRIFASNQELISLPCDHSSQGRPVGVYHRMNDEIPSGGRTARNLNEAQEAMGIDWLQWSDLKEAVPPCYTEFIGLQLQEAFR